MFSECKATTEQLAQFHAAKAIRQRLLTPSNSVQDKPLSLKKPSRGVNGLEAKIIAQEARERAEEARLAAAAKKQKEIVERQIAEIAKLASNSNQQRDWLFCAEPTNPRANKYPPNFINHIKQVVARKFLCTILDIESARRTNDAVIPRHVAQFLCKNLTPKSYPEIGRRFNQFDHTSALHAVRKMPNRMRTNAELCQIVVELQAKLEFDLEQWRSQG